MDKMLLEKIREYECLYNLQSPEYRYANARQTAWENIGKDLKISAVLIYFEVRRCFSNARSRRREGKKSGMASKKNSSQGYQAMKTAEQAKRKETLNTRAHQMVQILKDSSSLRKRTYEYQTTGTNISAINNCLDETDMFFLSISQMTKQLPKLVQAQIKLQMSNAVLAAEVDAQKSTYVTHYPQPFSRSFQQQSYPTAAPSPQVSLLMTSPSSYSSNTRPMTSPFNCSNEGQERPTLLEL
ncbi:hypothetical protein RN001_004504 [Aquatica leii]|uniref:MADF domain-containing protein n=1 Tax=Aquatica leii TaxID=1421715 RepID=A0AAN7P5F1_9COLE|nr:hypothetical protein RN001_004504 [Aquatica leii]